MSNRCRIYRVSFSSRFWLRNHRLTLSIRAHSPRKRGTRPRRLWPDAKTGPANRCKVVSDAGMHLPIPTRPVLSSGLDDQIPVETVRSRYFSIILITLSPSLSLFPSLRSNYNGLFAVVNDSIFKIDRSDWIWNREADSKIRFEKFEKSWFSSSHKLYELVCIIVTILLYQKRKMKK